MHDKLSYRKMHSLLCHVYLRLCVSLLPTEGCDAAYGERDVVEGDIFPGNAAAVGHWEVTQEKNTNLRANPFPPVQLLNRAP